MEIVIERMLMDNQQIYSHSCCCREIDAKKLTKRFGRDCHVMSSIDDSWIGETTEKQADD